MTKRKVEVFSAGCSICDDAIKLVQSLACPSCEVTVLDMKDIKNIEHAKSLGVTRVPAVAAADPTHVGTIRIDSCIPVV